MKALVKEEMENMNLKYYNPEIHKASFVLPEFARKVCLTYFHVLTCISAVPVLNRPVWIGLFACSVVMLQLFN